MTGGKGDLEIRAPCYHVTWFLLKPMFVKRENPAGRFGDCLPSQCFLLQLLEDSLKRAGGCSGLLFGDFACLSAHCEVGLFALNRLNNPYTTQAAAVG